MSCGLCPVSLDVASPSCRCAHTRTRARFEFGRVPWAGRASPSCASRRTGLVGGRAWPCKDGVDWCVASKVVALRQGDVADLDILVGPLVEQLDAANLLDDVLGQDLVAGGGLDLDLSVVRHAGRNLLNRIDELTGRCRRREILRWRLGVGGRVGCVVVEDGRRSRSFFRLLWLVVVCLALWWAVGARVWAC